MKTKHTLNILYCSMLFILVSVLLSAQAVYRDCEDAYSNCERGCNYDKRCGNRCSADRYICREQGGIGKNPQKYISSYFKGKAKELEASGQ